MEENLKKQIDNFFEGKNEILTKKALNTITRRFFSRFLTVGAILDPNALLLPFMKEKDDLWPKGVKGNDDFGNLMETMYDIPIQIKHAYELYNHLGMDLDDRIQEIKKNEKIKAVVEKDEKPVRPLRPPRPIPKPKIVQISK